MISDLNVAILETSYHISTYMYVLEVYDNYASILR